LCAGRRAGDARVVGWRRKLLVTAGVLVAAGLVVAAAFDRVVVAALTPGAPFDPAAAPAPPDYADAAAWSALPTREDAADVAVATLARGDQTAAPVDVFYVHPTSYVGRAWNGAIGDLTVDDATDRGATRLQASIFNHCCAVYAPRYRQANLTALLRPSADGDAALRLAGDDVLAAFRHYLAQHGHDRPFILAAHSQGALMALRVLREAIAATPLQDRLVVAYILGGPLTDATLAQIPGVPVCRAAGETGCVVAWNARSADYAGGLDFVESPPPPPGARRVCVNPLTWRADEDEAPASLHRGAVFFDQDDEPPTPRPGFTGARCQGGTLIVAPAEPPPRDFMSRLLDHALGAGNYHPIEVNLFFVDPAPTRPRGSPRSRPADSVASSAGRPGFSSRRGPSITTRRHRHARAGSPFGARGATPNHRRRVAIPRRFTRSCRPRTGCVPLRIRAQRMLRTPRAARGRPAL
jgi:hypothetical protein